ncbi:HAD family phosphatase [Pseudoflavonifractor sp. 524-17]|uniref:HAD family hydrolase n=1 Tax=Pseudoflavonifractor sp. 524-17 TaxID=2304577 RepID=UPI0013797AB5|nr:HAD family phosphatase [Pseudoflavonifractor sp. 524-17]NCE65007.1 HAD family phosphatase [Pseudoflavonifractor sp. 524-17]
MLLFDLDGTLIDSNGVWVEVDRLFLARRGLTPTEEYSYTVGHSYFPAAAQFTRDYYRLTDSPQAIMDEWLALAGDAYACRVPLKPGVRAFLSRQQAQGQKMALVTACVPELCGAALERHGLTGYFPKIFFAQDLGFEKQDPRYFQTVLAELKQTAQACTLFEDSPGACRTARELGLKVVGVYDSFYQDRQEELRSSCHRYIRSFTEL